MIRGGYDIVLAVFIALCLLIGGASGAGLLVNFLLQILALAMLVVGFCTATGAHTDTRQPLLRWSAMLMVLIAALQFLPLPASLWPSLPGRAAIAEGFDLLGQQRPWLNLSLAPFDSLASLMWLLPALAVVYVATRLLDFRAERVAIAVCTVAVASVPLGAMQVINGANSGWYLYERSGFGQGTGFFANGNHQATFLLIAIALLAALYASYAKHDDTAGPAARLGFAAILLVLVSGVLLTGSMAGIGLLLVALPAGYVLMTPRIVLPGPWVLFTAGLAGVVLVIALANSGLQQAGSALEATGPMSRQGIAATTLEAGWAYFPFGSGIGTFGDVYRMFEDPAQVTTTYINHAHNDYLELLLETGLLGVVAVVVFLAWWVRRSLVLWTSDRKNFYGLAGSLATGIVLVHSLVDYPLRTAAVSVLFALAVALMARSTALWTRSKRSKRTNRAKKKKITL